MSIIYMISSKLDPSILPKQTGGLKAERTLHRVTFNPNNANPGETLYISVPKLHENLLLVPGTLGLRFDLSIQPSTADARFVVNNVGRNLVNRMKIKLGGECLYDLNRYDLYKTYRDLFHTPEERMAMVEFGVEDGTLAPPAAGKDGPLLTDGKARRQARSKSTENSSAVDPIYGTKFIIPLDFELVKDHGVFYSRILDELQFEVTLADTANILESTAKITGSLDKYKMTSLELQYETIHSDMLANTTRVEYNSKAFIYEHVNLYKTVSITLADKEAVMTESINIPRRSLQGLLLLFIRSYAAGLRHSEEFIFPGITDLKVSINGVPNKVFSQGMKAPDFYRAVGERFGYHIEPHNFYKKISNTETDNGNQRFAAWIDLASFKDFHGNGLKLMSTQDGVTLEIKYNTGAGAPSATMKCYIFVVADAQANIENGRLASVLY